MRRPRRGTPSRRLIARGIAAQAPIGPRTTFAAPAVPGTEPGTDREADPLTRHALEISRWLDTGEGERRDGDG